jgi:hypothetical protein
VSLTLLDFFEFVVRAGARLDLVAAAAAASECDAQDAMDVGDDKLGKNVRRNSSAASATVVREDKVGKSVARESKAAAVVSDGGGEGAEGDGMAMGGGNCWRCRQGKWLALRPLFG